MTNLIWLRCRFCCRLWIPKCRALSHRAVHQGRPNSTQLRAKKRAAVPLLCIHFPSILMPTRLIMFRGLVILLSQPILHSLLTLLCRRIIHFLPMPVYRRILRKLFLPYRLCHHYQPTSQCTILRLVALHPLALVLLWCRVRQRIHRASEMLPTYWKFWTIRPNPPNGSSPLLKSFFFNEHTTSLIYTETQWNNWVLLISFLVIKCSHFCRKCN